MSETTPNQKGPAPATYKPAATEPAPIPADQVKPEDIGTLSIEYRDGQPVIVVSGGKSIPAGLTIVDETDAPVGAYVASVESARRYNLTISLFQDDTTDSPSSGRFSVTAAVK
ncbi:hypothetical protein [Streptomyces cyaneofuscatus]|uniref:hypothetical protein n=1 Tax=Streptomyces cyaneofuscatus TaxID=66883 RepID=UPI00364F0983